MSTSGPITIALVGGDGSGKSTIARRLAADPSLGVKYIYMGPSLESASHLLPWSRLALRFKLARLRRRAGSKPSASTSPPSTHTLEQRERPSSVVRFVLRSANQYVELLYRLAITRKYQRQGFHVVFDRHILYEISAPSNASGAMAWFRSRYVRLLGRTCPRPSIAVLLLASPQAMLDRKGETSLEYLARRNQGWIEMAARRPELVQVSADADPDEVYASVLELIGLPTATDTDHRE